MSELVDVVVIGAGAAGLMCAAVAGQRGRRVVLIDHATKLAEKIRISGGGRCNFTNLHTTPAQFLSDNPHFCKSALARYTPQDFLALVRRYGIAFHEKHKGQLFCDDSAEQIINMLKAECDAGQVQWRMPCKVQAVLREADHFLITTELGALRAEKVVIATGGLSIPKIGASDFAYRIASQFDLNIVPPRPGLVPLTFAPQSWQALVDLAGVALEVDVNVGAQGKQKSATFREDLLFTHRGLSGPAILQISSYWSPDANLTIDLLPQQDLAGALIEAKLTSKKQLANVLGRLLPARLASHWQAQAAVDGSAKMADLPDKALRRLGALTNAWTITPDGTEGYRKAEVTVGGVDTRELSQQTMMVNRVPGLHFIGESVDVTGWLGGYNFQWAWSSGVAAGLAV